MSATPRDARPNAVRLEPAPGSDRLLSAAPSSRDQRETIGSLRIDVTPCGPDTLGEAIHDRFGEDPHIHAIPIVKDDGVPIGLVNRYRFLDAFSRRFGRDLLGRKPAIQFMEASPLIVDESMSFSDLTHIIVDDAAGYIYDGFILTRQGRYVGLGTGYSLVRALTERRQAYLYHLAHHDVLTGLANRHHFDECLGTALAAADAAGTQVGLLFVDLDRFKAVNDTFGHATGDLLLKAVADRLRCCVRTNDIVTRLSGDEFAVVLPGISGPDAAMVIARTLVDTIAEAFFLDGFELRVSCSLGVSIYPHHGRTAQKLLNHADAAAYHAKQVRNTCEIYRPDMSEPNVARVCTYSTLRKAIEERQLTVHYQPKIDVRTAAICGLEALVRWPHPTEGFIAASDIVSVAEETGLMLPLTEWVLHTACMQALEWQEFDVPLRLAVNVSGVQFKQNTLVHLITRVLESTGLPASCLEIELTESVIMHHAPSAMATLQALKAMDIKIAIDDFGTGYSSLSYLQRLPVDALKIDKSFVSHIDQSEKGSAIAKAIITMAHSLDLRVIAEGVETSSQLDFLCAHGCDEVQGYVFSQPLPSPEATRLLRAATALRADIVTPANDHRRLTRSAGGTVRLEPTQLPDRYFTSWDER